MDLRVTKERFNEHWTYDWVKYVSFILVAIAIVSLLFSLTERKLTDVEELRIVTYSKFNGQIQAYNTNDDLRDYILSQNLENSEYLDNEICYYAYSTTPEELQAAQANLEAELTMGNVDVLLLPVLPNYFDEEGNLLEYARKFEYFVGVGQYVSLDEVIELEIAKNNPAAIELKETLEAHPEYNYSCMRKTPNSTETDEYIHDAEVKNYGINLNALNLSKVNTFVCDNDLLVGLEPCNYAIGILKDSGSYSEAICFINWFVKNYS